MPETEFGMFTNKPKRFILQLLKMILRELQIEEVTNLGRLMALRYLALKKENTKESSAIKELDNL